MTEQEQQEEDTSFGAAESDGAGFAGDSGEEDELTAEEQAAARATEQPVRGA